MYDNDKFLSAQNMNYTDEEKNRIMSYCQRAREYPIGYGNCQSNIIFYYRAPNNVISILRANNDNWQGLFIRHI